MLTTKEETTRQEFASMEPSKSGSAGEEAVAQDAKATLGQVIRASPRMFLFTLGLASYKLLFGIETVSIGTISTVPMFRQVFGVFYGGKWIIPAGWVSIWAASNPIGIMIGSVLGGWTQDRIGRRWTLQIFMVLQIITIIICYLADTVDGDTARRGMYFAGKLVQGLTLSASICAAQAYISEVLPTQLRGPMLATLSIFMLLGQLLGSIIIRTKVHMDDVSSYRIPIAMQWVFSAIPLFVALLIPESPAWLMRRDRWEDARTACDALVGHGSADMAEQTYQRIRVTILYERSDEASQEHATYMDCFRRAPDRRRTLIACFCASIEQLFGLAVLGHSSYFLVLMGMSSSTATTILIAGIIIGIIANICAFWILGRVGRRKLLLLSLGLIAVLWVSLGVAGCFYVPAAQWYFGICMMLVTAAAGVGAWPASNVVAGEVSSITLRAKTSGLLSFTQGLATGIFASAYPFIYNTDAGDLGGKTGFIVAGFTAIALLVTYFHVPELKGRPPIEVDKMFELGLKARAFYKWSSTEGEEARA